MKQRAHAPIEPKDKDVGRKVIFTGGHVPEEGVLTKLIDFPPGHVMVSFGGCKPEAVPVEDLKWGRGRCSK